MRDILKKIVNPCFPNLTHRQLDPSRQLSGSSNLIIRAAEQKDLTNLSEVLATSFHDQSGIWRWAYPLWRLGIYEDLKIRLRSINPTSQCLVAIEPSSSQLGGGDRLTGTVEIGLRSTFSWQRPLHYPYISNLAVQKSSRRKGIAQKLLLACEQTALEWGFKDIYLHVMENNHHARQLYIKLGYNLCRIEPSWGYCILRQPRRLFLHKQLISTKSYR